MRRFWDWCGADAGISHRTFMHTSRHGGALLTQPVVAQECFARLLGALEVRAKPLRLRSPLTCYCAALLRQPRDTQRAALAALRPLVEAAMRRRPPSLASPPRRPERSGMYRPRGGGGEDAEEGHASAAAERQDAAYAAACVSLASCSVLGGACLFAPPSDEAAVAAALYEMNAPDAGVVLRLSASATASASASAHAASASARIDWEDAPERVAVALAALAPSLFDDVVGACVAPHACALRHSCVPNVRLETTPSGCLAACALRHIAPGEELTAAHVPVNTPLSERRAALAEALHGFVCTCCRCAMDADARCVATMPACDVHALAAQAQLERRFADAAALLRALLARPLPPGAPPDAEARCGLARCLRAEGRRTEAAALWADAVARRAPVTAAHAAQAAQDGSFWPADTAPAQLSLNEFAVTPSDDDFCLLPLGAGAGGAEVAAVSVTQLLSPDGCARAVAAAEAAAALRRRGAGAGASGGAGSSSWGSSRSLCGGVPCSDMPLHEVPSLLAWFNDALRTSIAPLLVAAFPRDVRLATQLRVLDAHVLRYAAAAEERHLPLHAHDDAAFSVSVALNPKTDYAGGGTFFEASRTVVCPDVGHVVAFRGAVRHGGEPLTSGVRYVIACNLGLVPVAEARGAADEARKQAAEEEDEDEEEYEEEEEEEAEPRGTDA
jgi:hypothetical protein